MINISIDIKNISSCGATIPGNRSIIHLTTSSCKDNTCHTATCIMSKLEDDLDCHVEVCNDWPSLMIRLTSLVKDNYESLLLIIDSNLFQDKIPTIQDISNMISVIYRCSSFPKKMHLAVSLLQSCSMEFIKEMQNADVQGIIPCAEHFGYDRVLESIKEILSGHTYWPKDIISVITDTPISIKKTINTQLTHRQEDIFRLVVNRGLSNKKIASILGITESTVKLHMGIILKKYGVKNRTQLAVFSNIA